MEAGKTKNVYVLVLMLETEKVFTFPSSFPFSPLLLLTRRRGLFFLLFLFLLRPFHSPYLLYLPPPSLSRTRRGGKGRRKSEGTRRLLRKMERRRCILFLHNLHLRTSQKKNTSFNFLRKKGKGRENSGAFSTAKLKFRRLFSLLLL